ncbi:MAG: hypothetical protein K6A96_05545 [Prevotella sp.]|nr:hypothetical protein [Prevotella sp.]
MAGGGVGPGGTCSIQNQSQNLEEMENHVDLQVHVIFSSMSYSKFCQEQGAKVVRGNKPAYDTKIVLYAGQTWPAETYSYNEDADEVIFIDCGSDKMSQYLKSGKGEEKLTKYVSFAIMRLKDILYRMSKTERKTGKVHCSLIALNPCQKCMFAMSALLGKIISDGAIYNSFVFKVVSQKEYRYTFNWIRNYGWSIDVKYNCLFNPYQARIEAQTSPLERLNDLDRLLGGAEVHFSTLGTNWKKLLLANPAIDVAIGGVMVLEAELRFGKGAELYDTLNNLDLGPDKPYRGNWEDSDKKFVKIPGGGYITYITDPKKPEVWQEADPKDPSKVKEGGHTINKEKWVGEDGKWYIRYRNQVRTYEEWYVEWKVLAHPDDTELKRRVDEAKAEEEKAQIRYDRTAALIAGAKERSADGITHSFINEEIKNLRKNPEYANLTSEQAQQMLAKKGFIPRTEGGDNLLFIDGKYVTESEAGWILDDADKNLKDAKKVREEAEKALELKERSDKLFWLNALQTLFIVPCSICAPFAIVDIALTVAVFHQQGSIRVINGENYWGDNVDKGLLIGTIIFDLASLGPVFMKFKGGMGGKAPQTPTPPRKAPEPSVKSNAKGELDFEDVTEIKQIEYYADGSRIETTIRENGTWEKTVYDAPTEHITNSPEPPKPPETPNVEPPKPPETPNVEPPKPPETPDVKAKAPEGKAGKNKSYLYVDEKGELRVVDEKGKEHKALGVGRSHKQASKDDMFGSLDGVNEKAYVRIEGENGKGHSYVEIKKENAKQIKETWGKKPEKEQVSDAPSTVSEQSQPAPSNTDTPHQSNVSEQSQPAPSNTDTPHQSNVSEQSQPAPSNTDTPHQSNVSEQSQPAPNNTDSSHNTPSETKASPGEQSKIGNETGSSGNDTATVKFEEQNNQTLAEGGDANVTHHLGNNEETLPKITKYLKTGAIKLNNGGEKYLGGIGKALSYYNAYLVVSGDTYIGAGEEYQKSLDFLNENATLNDDLSKASGLLDPENYTEGNNAGGNNAGGNNAGGNNAGGNNGDENYGKKDDFDVIGDASTISVSDAQFIADDTKQSLDSMQRVKNDMGDMYNDYEQMNASANNVLAANDKLQATEEFLSTRKQMSDIIKQKENEGLSSEEAIEAAIRDDKYIKLYQQNIAAMEKIEGKKTETYTVNPDTALDIANAQLQGAQVDLMLQQWMQNEKDKKLEKELSEDRH